VLQATELTTCLSDNLVILWSPSQPRDIFAFYFKTSATLK
jgi:hypothetical protein